MGVEPACAQGVERLLSYLFFPLQISQNFRESSWAYIQLRFSDTLLTTLHRYISQIQIHFATLTHFPHTTPRMNPHCDLGSTLRVLRL